jgi:cerevisin
MKLLIYVLALCAARGSYIVMLDSPALMGRAHSEALYNTHLVRARQLFRKGEGVRKRLRMGYLADMSEATAAKIKEDPAVKMVEKDSPVRIDAVSTRDPGTDDDLVIKDGLGLQRYAPWGLVRISESRSRVVGTYRYPKHSGMNVDVYVLDTGVEVAHPEFRDRARWGANLVDDSPDTDENGHGTHCAGVIAGKTFGVAKNANIIAVKILNKDGTGLVSKILEGIDYVIGEHDKKKDELYSREAGNLLGMEVDNGYGMAGFMAELYGFPGIFANGGRKEASLARKLEDLVHSRAIQPKTIASMSLGGIKSPALNFAARYAAQQGIHFSFSAGNEREDACEFSPGSARVGITTGASNYKDNIAHFSNTGSCVDVFAPGVDILSSWINGTQKIASGTSMATPHTTGVMATYLTYFDYKPEELKKRILHDSYHVIHEEDRPDFEFWPISFLLGDDDEGLPLVSIHRLFGKIRKD